MTTLDTPVQGVERAALALVLAEVVRAGEKFGPQTDFTDAEWLAVLVEEVGEAAEIVNDRRLGKFNQPIAEAAIAEELVQVAAVAVRWLSSMGRRNSR